MQQKDKKVKRNKADLYAISFPNDPRHDEYEEERPEKIDTVKRGKKKSTPKGR